MTPYHWRRLVLALLLAPSVRAQDRQAVDSTAALAPQIDSIVARAMRSGQIRGGVVALVHGPGSTLLRAYGTRDGTRPVRVDSTVFGVSSITKVFTTLAALQQVERGRLSLEGDVQSLVPEVPLVPKQGGPVRLRDLMVHAGGFDDLGIGVAARSPDGIAPLAQYLGSQMPRRVRPSGMVASYSNHGFALLGLLVERAARRPIDAVLADEVFTPLGMMSSSVSQPLPGDLEQRRALPLRRAGVAVPRIYFNDAPASAMYTSASDMARFMHAFLATPAALPLGAQWSERMRTRQFVHAPHVHGLALGLRERIDAGVPAVEQGGDWEDYSSNLIMSPASGWGLFVAFSADGAYEASQSLWSLVQPGGTTHATIPAPASVDIGGLSGTYRDTRHSRATLGRVGVLTGAVRERTVQERQGSLYLLGTQLVARGDDAFTRGDTGAVVAFRRDPSGQGRYLFFENSPYSAYERVAFHERRDVHLALLAASLVLLAWGAFSRRDVREAAPRARALRVVRFVFAGSLLLVIGVIALLASYDPFAFQYGLPRAAQGARLSLWLLPLGGVVALVQVVRVGRLAFTSAAPGLGQRRVQLASLALLILLLRYWHVAPW